MTSPERSSADAAAARLGATSRLVASALEAALPAARRALGADVGRWLETACALAEATAPAVGAAIAFLRLDPARVARVAPARVERWVAAVGRVGAVSRPLAAAFAEATAALVGDAEPAWLEALAAEAAALRARGDWRGERLALALVAAAPAAAAPLAPAHLGRWGDLLAAACTAQDEAAVLRGVPAEARAWPDADRARWLGGAGALARRQAGAGVGFFRDLPAAIADVDPALRPRLLDVLATAATGASPTALHGVLPLVGALLTAVPGAHRPLALAAAARVAEAFPAGVVPLFRVLPRLFEEAAAERVEPWVAHGLALADDYPEAAEAYFALESRTSLAVLRASPVAASLDDAQSVLRKVVQMLSGRPASPHAVGRFQLRPPLEDEAGGGGIALPSVIDVFDDYESNRRLFGVLAAFHAGRRLHGTDDQLAAVRAALDAEDRPPFLDELFLLADGVRVAQRLAAEFPGVAADVAWACRRLLARWEADPAPPPGVLFDALLALALDPHARARATAPWLATTALVVLPVLGPMAAPDATAQDALDAARRLAPLFAHLFVPATVDPLALESVAATFDFGDGDAPYAGGLDGDDAPAAPRAGDRLPEELLRDLQVLLDDAKTGDGSGASLSVDELKRLIESGLLTELAQGTGTDVDANGLYVTQLMGKLVGARPELVRAGASGLGPRRVARLPQAGDASPVFYYDEWDHLIGDYRPSWCALREVAIADDAGVFFERALARHADLVPELRRCFQQVRPERYRSVRGLEDGESIDWNAAVEARVERRVRGTTPTKLYTARQRQEREVATLFLLDMSASTDEAATGTAGERIIDIAKSALVIMAAALEEIGDTFAVYGFSGQGRDRVEVYPVKRFGERLTPTVKGRLGGIEPKGSTRMGTALRHATALMRGLTAPSQHLVLISDGFPQDLDYGQDRQSHVYGIRDTATALRETQAAGIRPFCITVDLAGHDYLREMCDPDAYLVIERVADLPRELPRIYQRLVRAA